jgi:uncharacterized protein (TIGR04255 family)
MRIKFKKPPINEVAIGVYFEQELQPFRTEHVGLFWSKIRTEYPMCRQQPVIAPPVLGSGPPIVEMLFTNELAPMPRYLFESVDGATLIQVQKNGFLFNWRKRDAEYPHFDSVKAGFDKNYALFSNFLHEVVGVEKLAVQVADLTYINLIDANSDYWRGPNDTRTVFPGFSAVARIDAPVEFNQQTRFALGADMTLNVAIRNGKSTKERGNSVLLFELRALGVLGSVGKSEADEWFNRAHDAVGDCFLNMTSPDIQGRFWERV